MRIKWGATSSKQQALSQAQSDTRGFLEVRHLEVGFGSHLSSGPDFSAICMKIVKTLAVAESF